jgi:hypothetical protein
MTPSYTILALLVGVLTLRVDPRVQRTVNDEQASFRAMRLLSRLRPGVRPKVRQRGEIPTGLAGFHLLRILRRERLLRGGREATPRTDLAPDRSLTNHLEGHGRPGFSPFAEGQGP